MKMAKINEQYGLIYVPQYSGLRDELNKWGWVKVTQTYFVRERLAAHGFNFHPCHKNALIPLPG